jgi:NADH:ubiquinone oxidoreductase subunit C
MTIDDDLKMAESLLEKIAISSTRLEESRVDFVINAADLKTATRTILRVGHWGYLSAITTLDCPEYVVDETTKEKKLDPGKGHLEVLYHFCREAAVVTLRVSLPYADPTIDTICDILSSATLYEREAAELMGITFKGTPNTDRLILAESWPEGVYPLRKAFTGLKDLQTPEEGACS